MKITSKQVAPPPTFYPVEVTITLQSQHEVDVLMARCRSRSGMPNLRSSPCLLDFYAKLADALRPAVAT